MNRHDRIANDWLREMSARFAREFGEEEFMGARGNPPQKPPIKLAATGCTMPTGTRELQLGGFSRGHPPNCKVCKGKGTVTGVFPWLDPYHERTEICEACNGTGAER